MIKTNRYNEINLEKWEEYKSVCTDTFWNKNIDIFSQLLTRYTKTNDTVLVFGENFNFQNDTSRKIINFDNNKKSITQKKKVQFIIACPNNKPLEAVFDSNIIDILKLASKFLEKKRFLAFICNDAYFNNKLHLYGFEYASRLIQMGLTLKTVIIKETNNLDLKGLSFNLWRYRSLEKGFNVINHEYIFIFEKV